MGVSRGSARSLSCHLIIIPLKSTLSYNSIQSSNERLDIYIVHVKEKYAFNSVNIVLDNQVSRTLPCEGLKEMAKKKKLPEGHSMANKIHRAYKKCIISF